MISKMEFVEFEKHHAFILLFLVIATMFLVNIFAFNTAYNSVSTELNSNYEASRANGPVVIEKEVVVEVEPEQPDEPTRLEGLGGVLESTIQQYDMPTAVYVQDLSTGETVGVNQNTTFVAASHYKLFVTYEIARQIDLGILEPTADSGYDAAGVSIKECIFRTLN